MKTNRLEAFSDGVFAIIITIMLSTINHQPSSGPYRQSGRRFPRGELERRLVTF
jgi:uncharacterized membrane protein